MSQKTRLYNLLKDGQPHRTDEILKVVYGGESNGLARVGARIHDIKAEGHTIEGYKDPNRPALYWYWLKTAPGGTETPKETDSATKPQEALLPTLSKYSQRPDNYNLWNL